jgi:hypothetical protein
MALDERYRGIDERVSLQGLLGYLNFAEGRPDPRFQKQLHDACAYLLEQGTAQPWVVLRGILQARLQELHLAGSAAFADVSQAGAVIDLALDSVLTAYRAHHRDLLAHQNDAGLFQPFFLVRACEAVLQQRGPWQEGDRIVEGALNQLNDYVGHRPVATLENKRRGEIYPHERVRPIPLFVRGAGVAAGKYHDLVERALQILEATPESIRTEAYFDLTLLDELAVDPRAYDFGHPADKRPNYSFGEWDPHHLDNQARYRRFVVRQLILDALWQRIETPALFGATGPATSADRSELLYEAAAVFAGTILMASGVSGSGPQVHDSATTLSTLVPRIARYREMFYADLLPRLQGAHADRLKKEAQQLKQPFGGARQALNQYLARQRALQLQQWHLALLFAQIGDTGAARRQSSRIPVASVRMLTEMQILTTTAHRAIDQERLADAATNLGAIEDLLKRGIACGAIVDPWNILGFQGQYPRFQALEDSVNDPRIDDLVRMIDQFFDLYGRLQSEGASAGNFTPGQDLTKEMRRLAAWWDRFATTTVGDVQHVHGSEAAQSAEHVARCLRRWHERGAASADLSFWREQRDGFRSPKAFALVVNALLHKRDFRAASALLVTWLGQAEQIPLVEGDHSFHHLALRWMLGVCLAGQNSTPEDLASPGEALDLVIKFFDFLEANADEYWQAPRLDVLGTDADEPAREQPDDEDSLYGAAYEEMTYKDSTDDDVEGEVLDIMPQKDFDLLHEATRLEPRLQFMDTLARLWNIATRCLRGSAQDQPDRVQTALTGWLERARHNEGALRTLLDKIHEHDIPRPTGDYASLVEYDRRRVAKEQLVNQVLTTCLDLALAIGAMRSLQVTSASPPSPPAYAGGSQGSQGSSETGEAAWDPLIVGMERALLRQDPAAVRALLPQFKQLFRHEPLLYTPLSQGGHPQMILRASLAQTIMRGLVHNLPRQGLVRETYQLLRMARAMEAGQTLTGPRITEYDRLFQIGLQAVVEASLAAAARAGIETERLVAGLETIVEPFAVTWRDHSQTLRISILEQFKNDKEWQHLTGFIKRYGRDLFQPKFLALANLRAILTRGVGAYLRDLRKEPDPLQPLKLLDELDQAISFSDAENYLQIILQALLESYDHLRDYNATTTQSDYGDNLYRLFDFLRLKARYDRAAWLLRPLNLAHEILARHDGAAAVQWREAVEVETRQAAAECLQELTRLERKHGIRLATIRARLEERFVQPMVLDRLCALIEPALAEARVAGEQAGVSTLEKELEPLAAVPSGVGFDVPDWLARLENEYQRVRSVQSDLGSLADTALRVPTGNIEFSSLVDQLRDWEQLSLEGDL